jgi:hypothetical protein
LSTELATQLPPDDAPEGVPVKKRARNPNAHFPKDGKLRLVTRAMLDQRTLASKQFDALVAQIRRDSGDSHSSDGTFGDSRFSVSDLTAIQLAMIEAFAGCSVMLDALTVKVLLGEQVDPFAYCQLSSTLTRIGSRLGITRKARTVETPSLGSYLDGRADKQDDEPGDGAP